ncbi:Do family serine endopeptidase [Sulfuritalea sp.]|uniref:Do family serine endopeptidase n=1 Tax=Sulfuritalea sp. TaxID=2480090 RepID=UPI001AC110F5|nr:Do family serine endopeptidase [Sulfuritalea sp.]MBN8473510.1 Do family serine endopeptidase [Sulfuritalea sp.]
MRRLWLIFAQTVTICVAVLFVVKTLKPEWLAQLPGGNTSLSEVATVLEAVPRAEAHRPASYADAAKRAIPAVVHIFTSQEVAGARHPFINDPIFRHFFGDRFGEQSQRRSGLGSGVVVSPEGYILTNFHVIEGADEIEVAHNDGRKYKARVVGSDPESDLAVLRIPADHKLPVIAFGSSDNLRVGDVVLAIGNPFGVGQTVTSGIVSALGRSHLGINTFENFIQTDAAINPGNSGGALVDANGHLVGINTAIYSQSGGSMGIGFAIPVSLAKSVMEQIVRTGSVTRGWVGIEVQEITPELAESFKLSGTDGALIAGVMRGSPADKSGIKPGDVLVQVTGKPVKDAQAVLELIAALQPGSKARFGLKREGRDVAVDVTIGKRPRPPKE